MTTTTIRITCSSCQLPFDVPATALVLALPAPRDTTTTPLVMHVCPRCTASDLAAVSWHTAVYLLDAGATTLIAPDIEQMAPRYPEQRPAARSPMTLDDLIDLYAALDVDISTQ